jgi:enamine deaminase RidA (YjgF/YER057c/UK114 family)
VSKNSLLKLREVCPTGTAEGEIGIRDGIFVQFPTWTDLIVPPAFSPIVLVGKKGSGKSILVDFTCDVLKAKGIAFAKLLPRQLNLDAIADGASISGAHAHAYAVLVRAAAAALGEHMRGLLNSTETLLLEQAISTGAASEDIISKLAKFLPKVAKAATDVDISSLLPDQPKSAAQNLDKALKNALSNTKTSKAVYIFIDDTDQVAALSKPGHLNRIWGLLLAARELAGLSPEIRCIITLREEVWVRIANDKASQRDQTDHFYSLIKRLDPTSEQLKLVTRRRLEVAQAAAKEPRFADRYGSFFNGDRVHMPGSTEVTSWEDFIVTRSRGRPRDCIQLLNRLASHALAENDVKITERHIAEVIKDFSESRVELLAQENEQELPALKDVVRSFAPRDLYDEGSFKATTRAVLAHVRRIPSQFSLKLYGVALTSDNDEQALRLLSFLFRIGFLNARKARPGGRYAHISPVENPNLVVEPNRNELQTVTWEVHPAYRDFLISQQQQIIHRR